MRARPIALALLAAAAAPGACGGDTVRVAENGAPAEQPESPPTEPAETGRDGAGAIVVHDCGDGYRVSTHAGFSSGTELFLLGTHSNDEGEAFVRDSRASPHILAVSALEATHWRIEAAPGSGLLRVLLGGYDPQTAEVPPGVELTDVSGEASLGMYGYAWPPAEGGETTQALVGAVQALSGVRLSAFGGCYDAGGFSVREGWAGETGCEGAQGVGTNVGMFCDTDQPFIITAGLLCEDAIANCKKNAEANPGLSLACQLNDRLVFQQEVTPGACSGVASEYPCQGAEGEGPYLAVDCDSGQTIQEGSGLTCDEAFRECIARAAASPAGVVSCTWAARTLEAPTVGLSGCPP